MVNRFLKHSVITRAMLLAAVSAAPTPGMADDRDYNLHGFVSQAFLYSKGNNYFGDSTEGGGSWDFYEAGIGGQYRFTPSISLSGQLYARDAGRSDDGSVRVDYLYGDARFFQGTQSAAGVRLGRIRNPYGFYNATRDIFFTRPSIILPQFYYEGFGIRELFFSVDGAQLYSYWENDWQSTTLDLTIGRTDEIDSTTLNNISGGSSQSLLSGGDTELRRPLSAKLSTDLMGGRWRVALSLFDAMLTFDASNILAQIDTTMTGLSIQHNREKISYTLEYALLSTETLFSSPFFGGTRTSGNKGETAYLQIDYRQTHQTTWYGRLDHQVSDRTRPNETDSTVLTLGGRWAPNPQWLVAAELHGVRGTAPVPRIDNPNSPIAERSELFVIMAGYRF